MLDHSGDSGAYSIAATLGAQKKLGANLVAKCLKVEIAEARCRPQHPKSLDGIYEREQPQSRDPKLEDLAPGWIVLIQWGTTVGSAGVLESQNRLSTVAWLEIWCSEAVRSFE